MNQIMYLNLIDFRLWISELIFWRTTSWFKNAFGYYCVIFLNIFLLVFLHLLNLCYWKSISAFRCIFFVEFWGIACSFLIAFVQFTRCLWPHYWSWFVWMLIQRHSLYMLLNWFLLSPFYILFFMSLASASF